MLRQAYFDASPKRKLGKAFKCLEKAKESTVKLKVVNLTIPKFALAILTYCNIEFAQMKSEDCIRTAAQRFLGLSLEQFRDLSSENLYSARQCFALIYLASLALPLTHLHVCSLLLNVAWAYNAKLVSFQLREGFFLFHFHSLVFSFLFLQMVSITSITW